MEVSVEVYSLKTEHADCRLALLHHDTTIACFDDLFGQVQFRSCCIRPALDSKQRGGACKNLAVFN